ncbi:uncharacterized protein K452DRAFT_235383 [Aplosporella prunicola CBS 121167]|uniref:Aminoglycoside phosphotransferase domain-containing protein n=1 Tax=Aplosporella prunicola CBS 121167 TaxID=1176127 RepID=A0A6A6B176_9PEZI|nr:uncharacterized protein K452DRAFT_235383 [Aplosporella prunicola CBS 121167]KAF2137780.1 hypothetical protein K452DRAFT_235383 [Aplosporella prunicola CBS 121167]
MAAIFENIPNAVAKFGLDGSIPEFADGTLSRPLRGAQCHVYKLVFRDRTTWAVRVPIKLSINSAIDVTAGENEILRQLEASGFSWSPKLIGEELNFHNPVQFPFTVYNWIPGKQLQSQCLLDYLTRIIDNRVIRICRGQLKGFRIRDCFYHRNILSQVVDIKLDNDLYFMGHGDIAAPNIIIDSSFNISGILDWSFGAYEPFQLAAALPRIFRAETPLNPTVREQDRKCFINALRAELNPENRDIVLGLIRMYSQPDLDYRQQVLEAVISKGAFKSLSQSFPLKPAVDVDLEISQFLRRRVGQKSGLTKNELLMYL